MEQTWQATQGLNFPGGPQQPRGVAGMGSPPLVLCALGQIIQTPTCLISFICQVEINSRSYFIGSYGILSEILQHTYYKSNKQHD